MSDDHAFLEQGMGTEAGNTSPTHEMSEVTGTAKRQKASKLLVIAAFALAFVRLPWILILLCGYGIFYRKDARLARQCNQAFILWVAYTVVQFVASLLLWVIRWVSNAMADPVAGFLRAYEVAVTVLGVAVLISYLAVAAAVVIQLLVRGEVSLPVLRRMLVCFPPVKENAERGHL